jgi:hypothetical protein
VKVSTAAAAVWLGRIEGPEENGIEMGVRVFGRLTGCNSRETWPVRSLLWMVRICSPSFSSIRVSTRRRSHDDHEVSSRLSSQPIRFGTHSIFRNAFIFIFVTPPTAPPLRRLALLANHDGRPSISRFVATTVCRPLVRNKDRPTDRPTDHARHFTQHNE